MFIINCKNYNEIAGEKINKLAAIAEMARVNSTTKESGNNCNIKTLSDEKFLIELEKKLDEELIEYHESKSVEELTDLMEIIQRIAELKGIDNKTLQELQKQKAEKRGKFKKNLFLLETDEKI